jgi:hypothetical protein
VQCIIEQHRVRSISLYRSAPKDSIEIYFVFFKFYCVFYEFLKFIRISRIVKENEKLKNLGAQCWVALWPAVSACRPSPARDMARGGDGARWPVTRWCSVSDEVLPVSTGGSPRRRRARSRGLGLTHILKQQWVGVEGFIGIGWAPATGGGDEGFLKLEGSTEGWERVNDEDDDSRRGELTEERKKWRRRLELRWWQRRSSLPTQIRGRRIERGCARGALWRENGGGARGAATTGSALLNITAGGRGRGEGRGVRGSHTAGRCWGRRGGLALRSGSSGRWHRPGATMHLQVARGHVRQERAGCWWVGPGYCFG